MALDEAIHKKMVKIVFGKMLEEKPEDTSSVIETLKESAKPKIRGIKEFFQSGLKELRRDFQKKKRKSK